MTRDKGRDGDRSRDRREVRLTTSKLRVRTWETKEALQYVPCDTWEVGHVAASGWV